MTRRQTRQSAFFGIKELTDKIQQGLSKIGKPLLYLLAVSIIQRDKLVHNHAFSCHFRLLRQAENFEHCGGDIRQPAVFAQLAQARKRWHTSLFY